MHDAVTVPLAMIIGTSLIDEIIMHGLTDEHSSFVRIPGNMDERTQLKRSRWSGLGLSTACCFWEGWTEAMYDCSLICKYILYSRSCSCYDLRSTIASLS